MSVDARIDTLKSRHADLESRLANEAARPHPDDSLLHTLKREKLNVKDQMRRLSD